MVMSALLVDDDASSAQATAALLDQLGCRTRVCTDPFAVVDIALESGVDLVSLDISMPGRDGFELLSLIRSHEHSRRLPSVPIITVTGGVTAQARANAIASGFAAHVGKPVAADDLRAVIERVQALRAELYRTRYSVDQPALQIHCERLVPEGGNAAQAIAGLALALTQHGSALLRNMLEAAYAGAFAAAVEQATRLADAADSLGAHYLAALCQRLVDASTPSIQAFERQAVLVRAELDRITFTLRELVLG